MTINIMELIFVNIIKKMNLILKENGISYLNIQAAHSIRQWRLTNKK